MQTPLPIDEQIYVLRSYLITLQADHDRVSREFNRLYRKKRICPFVEELRRRRVQSARGNCAPWVRRP